MENASKALIIAGAILLAIVLVSLGVLVINNSRKDITDKNLDEASIEAFNKSISQYCGTNKTGTQMNNLMSAISSTNGAQKNKAVKHYIAFKCFGGTTTGANQYWASGALIGREAATTADVSGGSISYPIFGNNIKYDAKYTIDEDGYINQVDITEHT